MHRLNKGGFEAYLVGGGVRDLLLGLHPKDFDVATNAHPEQIQELFRNCRLIGRRFRLAHIYFKEGVIEVATFRARAEGGLGDRHISETGMLVRDNIYGTLEDDAWRRDFTLNALYYNIVDSSIVDFTGGMPDLKNCLIRVIGDPKKRYHEDPVRMLRAIRLAAKLKCNIDTTSEQPIFELAGLLQNVPGARLLEEVLKLYTSGKSYQSFLLLRQHGLFAVLFPQTEACLVNHGNIFENFIKDTFLHADERMAQNKSLHPAFMFAVLLWPPLKKMIERHQADGMKFFPALHAAMEKVIHQQNKSMQIPRRLTVVIREIWVIQYRLSELQRYQKRIYNIFHHPRFRAAYDFLKLRATAGEIDNAIPEWWTKFQEVNEHERNKMIHLLRKKKIPG